MTREVAKREVRNARAAVDAGLSTPDIYEQATIERNSAITYERIRGETMLSHLRSHPWTFRRNARRLAQLHLRIHTARPSGIRSVRNRLERNIKRVTGFDPKIREDILSRVESLPRGNACCHGDFHPQNVLLADEPVIIDWLDAGRGHPAADVARTSLLLGFADQEHRRTLSAFRAIFRWWYLRFYRERSRISREQVRAWELPVAVARLTEGVPEEARLRSFIDSRLPAG